MDMVEFVVADGLFPMYRTLSPGESQLLRALLGEGFRFPLEDGEPMDELLFDVLAAGGMRAGLLFHLPQDARVLGTFELRDGASARAAPREGTHPEPTVH